jgi:hypothetical protein
MNQPGCSLLDLPVSINAKLDPVDPQRTKDSVGRHLVACSHTRAFELYIESLKVDQGCLLIGHECRSFDEFKEVSPPELFEESRSNNRFFSQRESAFIAE